MSDGVTLAVVSATDGGLVQVGFVLLQIPREESGGQIVGITGDVFHYCLDFCNEIGLMIDDRC